MNKFLKEFNDRGFFYQCTDENNLSQLIDKKKIKEQLRFLFNNGASDLNHFFDKDMKIYKEEKVNPLGGCLPILIQIPVFIALYWVIIESVEMRHAPFAGWILDLSSADPLFILPILMGLSMYIQQKLNHLLDLQLLQHFLLIYCQEMNLLLYDLPVLICHV